MMKQPHERGIRVPDDMSVIGVDDHVLGIMSTPSLTTIHYPLKDLEEKAIEIVTRQIEFPGERPQTILLEPSLVVRQSTAPLRKAPQRAQKHGGFDVNQNHN